MTERRDAGGKVSRRGFIVAAGSAALGVGAAVAVRNWRLGEAGARSSVFVGRAADYRTDFAALILAGLAELGIGRDMFRGKRVLLKPNLVETAAGVGHINTHPSVVIGAVEALRRLDAAEVFVAEGQGHRRDSWLVLDESGMRAALDDAKVRFVDLNHDDVAAVKNAGRWTSLPQLHLPRTLLDADLIVSMPKLKTHHWAGITCAMKNLFGVMPGIVYGWPKNVLHWHGIAESILDINATVRPHLAIADGVVGMEGDGPIMGTPKPLGCVVLGASLPALDATCARLMGLNPRGTKYLATASGRLGPVLERNIEQRGETIASLRQRFAVLDLPHLQGMTKPE